MSKPAPMGPANFKTERVQAHLLSALSSKNILECYQVQSPVQRGDVGSREE